MTLTKDRLLWREKAALVLMRMGTGKPTKHFRRSDISKIRKMAHQGHTIAHIIKTLNLDMSTTCFSKRCKELNITLSSPTERMYYGRPRK